MKWVLRVAVGILVIGPSAMLLVILGSEPLTSARECQIDVTRTYWIGYIDGVKGLLGAMYKERNK